MKMLRRAIQVDKNVEIRSAFSCLLKAMLRLSIICMARDADNRPISILTNHIMHSSSISSLHFHLSRNIKKLSFRRQFFKLEVDGALCQLHIESESASQHKATSKQQFPIRTYHFSHWCTLFCTFFV